jgi:hypothetical protein
MRHPPLGPPTPGLKLALMLVTEGLRVQVHYLRGKEELFKTISCSLMQSDEEHEVAMRQPLEHPTARVGVKTCLHAAIGLGYDGRLMCAVCTLACR